MLKASAVVVVYVLVEIIEVIAVLVTELRICLSVALTELVRCISDTAHSYETCHTLDDLLDIHI